MEKQMKNSLKTALILMTTLFLWTGCDSSTTETGTLPGDMTLLGLSSYTKVDLNATQTSSLAYMWHEEKLAHDLYLALNAVNPAMQLSNIATKSESAHINYVEDLVEWYDINVTDIPDYNTSYSAEELDAMAAGEFAIDDIQNLYNTLYSEGSANKIESLKVGCKVEVIDVNDLDTFIDQSAGNQALVDTFTTLRAGSYEHYWTFHSALKKAGINNGCCSLGQEYCKTDVYPQSM